MKSEGCEDCIMRSFTKYYLGVIKSRMRCIRYVAHMEKTRNAYKNLVGKLEGNSSLGRPRCRWEDNSKIDLREIGWESVD
jgi:hypothetical protein